MNKNCKKSAIYYVLSFVIPMLIIFAALAGLKVTPFGDNSLVMSDGDVLYINYLGYVGRALKGQEGVLFSFEKGLGGNMMGSWGWFLINPFFVLFSLFDITEYMVAYTWVSVLNFSLCGLTMYILLKIIYGHKTSNLIFSTSYALNGFLVANVFQMNFFTGVPTLPLVVLGLRNILKGKNPLLYIIALAYSLLTNFYFGFILCTASVLIFVVGFAANYKIIENRKSVAAKYIISSGLAGLLSSIVWLPALLSLRGGRLDQSIVYSITMSENMPFLNMAAKLFTGANNAAELRDGLPNIFVGILPVFLTLLYFTDGQTKKEQKVSAAILIGFYLISFYIPVLNIAMHGGTVTNWFNYRDSFVLSFLLLMIAAEEWQRIVNEPKSNLKRTALILAVSTIIVFSKHYEFVTGTAVLIDIAILAVMGLALWMHRKNPEKNTHHAFEMVVLFLVSFNLFLNYYISTKNIMIWTNAESEYQKTVVPVSALVEAVGQSDNAFYRMEVGKQRSGNCGNDPMLYGYYGVGHGGSDDRDFVRLALSKLGVHRYDMRNHYGKGITSATDTILGLKYIISSDDLTEEKGYERLTGIGEWTLYRNPYTLPIAFVASNKIDDVETDLTDIFDNLNRTWSAISGEDGKIFIEETNVEFSSYNTIDQMDIDHLSASAITDSRDAKLELNSSAESESGSEESSDSMFSNTDAIENGSLGEKPEQMNYIKYTWTASRDGAVYSYNRSGMTEDDGAIIPALMYEGYYQKGETVTRYLPVFSGFVTAYLLEEVAGRFRTVYVDTDALDRMSKIVLSRPSSIERITDSFLKGEFTVDAGQELMLTIPFDEGWTIWIDGQKAEIKQVLGVFMAVDVTEGTHKFEMKFIPSGLKTGVVFAVVALAAIIIYIPVDSRRRKRVIRYN